MPAWLALALAIVGGGVTLAILCCPRDVKAGWERARAAWRGHQDRAAARRQMDRDGWRRP